MINVYGSVNCPGTLRFISILSANGVKMNFVNVTGSIGLLKDFIKLRDENPVFDDVRGTGTIGFPTIQLEDGTYTRNADAVLESLGISTRMVEK